MNVSCANCFLYLFGYILIGMISFGLWKVFTVGILNDKFFPVCEEGLIVIIWPFALFFAGVVLTLFVPILIVSSVFELWGGKPVTWKEVWESMKNKEA